VGRSAERTGRAFLLAVLGRRGRRDRLGPGRPAGQPGQHLQRHRRSPTWPGDLHAAAAELGRRSLAWLHLAGVAPGYDADRASRASCSGAPLILNGGYDRDRAEADLAAGRAEAISFGSTFIANPDLPERLRLRASLNAPDRATFYGGDARGYTDYPTLARAA
jgi:2,4-dienoyl-CoA reductase-like NADH-dependent reductase (Old Yellow Enzyme family)